MVLGSVLHQSMPMMGFPVTRANSEAGVGFDYRYDVVGFDDIYDVVVFDRMSMPHDILSYLTECLCHTTFCLI
jgi:hypothetical protein